MRGELLLLVKPQNRKLACWMISVSVLLLPNNPVPGQDPQPHNIKLEFEARLAESSNQGSSAQIQLADWAAKNDLNPQAENLYRDVLKKDPLNNSAYHGLVRLSKSQPLEGKSNTFISTRQLLPRNFRIHESKNYITISNANPRWTRTQANRLERTYEQFMRYTKKLKLKPLPLKQKLVCVLFKSRSEYQAFALKHDQLNLHSWNLGYYSPLNDRIVLYDGRSEVDADEFTDNRTIATTIHEAVHQLHFHTGVMNIHIQYPLWLCEGLATNFESNSTKRDFGPEQDFQPRREHFRSLVDSNKLLPLKSLVQLDALPDTNQQTSFTIYNQSYALVCWLINKRPKEFSNYLMMLRSEPPGRPTGKRHLELFEKAFGDTIKLQKQWLNYEAKE